MSTAHYTIAVTAMNAIRDVFTALNIVLQQNMYGWYVLLVLLVLTVLA